MTRKKTSLLAGAIVFSIGTAAFAAPAIDSLLVEGYDDENQVLVFGTSEVDQEGDEPTLDCTLEGTFQYVLAEEDTTETTESVVDEDEDGKKEVSVTEVEELTTEDGGTVIFDYESGDATGLDYGAEGAEECSLVGVDVTGPEGQVNHGTITSSFVHALQELGIRGAGCYIRTIAQSDYGKGDQQITVDGDEDTIEVIEDGTQAEETASVDLASHETSCEHGRSQDDHGRPDDAGRPETAGKPEGAGRPETAGSQSKKND